MEYITDEGVVEVATISEKKGRGVRSCKNVRIPAGAPLYCARPDMTVLYSAFGSLHCSFCFLPVKTSTSSYVCPSCDQFVVCQKCVERVLLPEQNADSSLRTPLPTESNSSEQKTDREPATDAKLVEHPFFKAHQILCLWYNELPASVRAPPLDTDYLRFTLLYGAKVLLADQEAVSRLEQLCGHRESQCKEWVAFCSTFARDKIVATFGPSSSHPGPRYPVSAEDLTALLLRVRCNSLGFPFTEAETIGWSLHHLACMMNHSCVPNAAIVLAETDAAFQALRSRSHDEEDKDKAGLIGSLGVVALREIQPGEEITISYVDLESYAEDVVARTRALLETFRFLCTCEKCTAQRAEKKCRERTSSV